jgi:homoserine kinase
VSAVTPVLRTGEVGATVPATSANLGPGFDSLGLALSLRDRLSARLRDERGVRVTVNGEGAGTLPTDGMHLVAVAMRTTFDALGVRPAGFELETWNVIPHGRGLGSSAAAIVAGVLLARGLVEAGEDLLGDVAALDVAARLEGHPDNVAATMLGGFTTAWTDDDGRARAVSRTVHPDVVPVVCIPSVPVATKAARALLPAQVPHSDAAFNAGRSALLVIALTERTDLLMAATHDRLHQRYREPAMPESLALVAVLRAAGIPALVSGAGPTVLALAGPATAARVAPLAPGFDVRRLEVDLEGGRAVASG